MTDKNAYRVTDEDIKKMTDALKAFKNYEWWFKTENPEPDKECLSPLVLQNMRLGFESGTLEPTLFQFRNLLKTAIFYQQKCRMLEGLAKDGDAPAPTEPDTAFSG